jgi:hypothetical protein
MDADLKYLKDDEREYWDKWHPITTSAEQTMFVIVLSRLAAVRRELAERDKPLFKYGETVFVDNSRYKGSGVVQYDTGTRGRMVGVLLENGNTWEYEIATVTLLPAPPKDCDDVLSWLDLTGRVIRRMSDIAMKEVANDRATADGG